MATRRRRISSGSGSYQWRRYSTFGGGGSASNIGGATSSTYTPVRADIGYDLDCAASNGFGSTPSSNTLRYARLATALTLIDTGISGSPIDTWSNGGSGGGSYTAAGAARPTATTLNGITAGAFGSGKVMATTTNTTAYASLSALEGFAVVQATSLGSDNATPYLRPAIWAETTGGRLGVSVSASGAALFIYTGSAYKSTGYVALTTGGKRLISWRLESGTLYCCVGETSAEVSLGGGWTIDSLAYPSNLGSNFDKSQIFDGTIAEVINHTSVLTVGQRADYRAFLNNRFALGLAT